MQCKTKPGSALHAPESLTLTGLIKALPLSETGATSTNPQSDLPCCVISLFGREDRWTEVWRTTVVALHPKSLHSSKNKKNSSLPSCWSSPVMSVETMRLLTNRLVVSVLRLTGVLWSVPADGCPVLGPAQLLCAAAMWLFLPGVVLTTWLSFYLKHEHEHTRTHANTHCWTKNGP